MVSANLEECIGIKFHGFPVFQKIANMNKKIIKVQPNSIIGKEKFPHFLITFFPSLMISSGFFLSSQHIGIPNMETVEK